MRSFRHPSLAGICLLVIGLAGGWMARGRLRPATDGPENRTGASVGVVPAVRPPPAVGGTDNSPPTAPLSPALALARKMSQYSKEGEPNLESFTIDQFGEYLERHDRNPVSLLAVWQVTRDKSLMREAYERFPDRLDVALAAFHNLDLSDEEKRALATRMEELHGDSPVGPILAGTVLAKEGKATEAIAKMKESIMRGTLDLDVRGRQLAIQEAMMSLGKSPLEAHLWSQTYLDSPVITFRNLTQPAVQETKSLLAAGNIDAALNLAGDVLAFARQVGNERGGTLVGDLVAHSIEASALRSLPPDVEIGETALTAAERLAEMKDRNQMISQAVGAVPWHMQQFDEPGLALFLQIRESRGELEAVKWAETYHGPAPIAENP